MLLIAWATLAVLAVYFWTGANARYPAKIFKLQSSPGAVAESFSATPGLPGNRRRQLMLALAPLALCALFDARWAAAWALLWCMFRIVYRMGYCQTPDRRTGGFVLGMGLCAVLAIGTMNGLLPH